MIKVLFIFSIGFGWMDIEFHEDKKLKAFFTANSAKLNTEFEEANQAYFEGDLQAAKQKYYLISLKAFDDNWDFYQRKVFTHTLLRLCQLQRKQCEDYLSKIIHLDADQVQHIDETTFEPPIIHQALLLRNQMERDFYLWQPTKDYENAKYFIVNGRIFTNNAGVTIPLPLAKQRIVVVYPNYNSDLYVGETSGFLKWKPKKYTKALPSKKIEVEKVSLPAQSSVAVNLEGGGIDGDGGLRGELDSSLDSGFWWKKNKKNVFWWSLAGGAVAYLIHKNNKSSSDGGPAISSSKE